MSIIVIILFLASEVQAADSGTVGYEPSFFAPTNPVTALDIVDRVPGFQLQRQGGVNGQVRGFGGAASNVLINGSRPSTKSTPIEKILQRISAADVIRVDLIRGATGSLESSQASVVVNLMVKERDNESSTLWGASLSIEDGHITPNGNIAWSGNWNATSYTLSAEREKYKFDYGGPEILTNFFGPDEYRDETVFVSENLLSSNIETETRLENGDIFRLNTQARLNKFGEREESRRFPEDAEDPDLVNRDNQDESREVEIGGDYERILAENLRL